MNKKVKFVWDFFGLDAKKTAEHSLHHVEDFLIKSKINFHSKGFLQESSHHFYSFVVIEMEFLEIIKEKLRPHRAFFLD